MNSNNNSLSMKTFKSACFLWLLCFLLGTTATASAQGHGGGITVEASNELLPSVFKKIEKQSKYKFIFVYEDVSKYRTDRKSTRLNSSHANISYAVFCLKKKK